MIRKTIIVLLTLTAFGIVLMLSCQTVAQWGLPIPVESESLCLFPGASPTTPNELCINASRVRLVWHHPTTLQRGKTGGTLDLRLFGTLYYEGSNWFYPTQCRIHRAAVPTWLLLATLLAYPTIAFIRGPVRRWRRRRKGLCVKCGYNLTGLSEPRCPECGPEIKQP